MILFPLLISTPSTEPGLSKFNIDEILASMLRGWLKMSSGEGLWMGFEGEYSTSHYCKLKYHFQSVWRLKDIIFSSIPHPPSSPFCFLQQKTLDKWWFAPNISTLKKRVKTNIAFEKQYSFWETETNAPNISKQISFLAGPLIINRVMQICAGLNRTMDFIWIIRSTPFIYVPRLVLCQDPTELGIIRFNTQNCWSQLLGFPASVSASRVWEVNSVIDFWELPNLWIKSFTLSHVLWRFNF